MSEPQTKPQQTATVSGTDAIDSLGAMMLTDAGAFVVKGPRGAWLQRRADLFRHPLTLLIVTSILIPSIIYVLQSRKSLTEVRQKKALEIVGRNAEFEGQLSSLYADLGFFNNSNQEILQSNHEAFEQAAKAKRTYKARGELDARRMKFDELYAKRYAEFAKSYSDQHLWVDDLPVEGIILELFSADDVLDKKPTPRLDKLRAHIEAYRKNVANSQEVLGLFHDALFQDGYYNTKEIGGRFTTAYQKLHEERKALVDELVKDFLPRRWF